jgi:hypothetical protein
MHPELSRARFDDAVAQLRGNPSLLRDRGWTIDAAEYPDLRITAVHRNSGASRTFRFRLDGWDERPPSLVVIDPETLEMLPGNQWPVRSGFWHHHGWGGEAGGGMPGQPFLCMKGIREYHTHSSHLGEKWENYRTNSDYSLPNIVSKVMEVYQQSHVPA